MPPSLEMSTLREHLPDGPISSLRRIQTLYGALAEAAGEKGGDPGYAIYYTPGDLDEFVAGGDDTDRYLACVDVDLTDGRANLDDVSVTVEQLTTDLVPKLGFARYPWGRGIDHSITRRGAKGGSDVATAATYCIECLERWTDADGREPAIGAVAESHPDGWILGALQDLGTDDAVKDAIEQSLDRLISGSPRVTATVRLKLDPAALSEAPADEADAPDWFYPGQVDVLNAGMKARKEEKLAEKNTDAPSRGEGTCMVTGESTEVFGTAEDPLALFTVQHAEKFDGLDRRNAWRAHPVSSNAALLVQSGSSLVDACRTTRNGLGVYTLPYFTTVSESGERAELLYRALTRLQKRDVDGTAEHPMAFVERVVENDGDEEDLEDLRFYVISLRNDSGDINVFHEVPDVTLYWPRQVATTYVDVLCSSAFDETAGFGTTDEWSLLSPERDADHVVNAVVSGTFAWNAVPSTAGDDGATVDDDVEWYTYRLLTGAPIPVDRLLDMFVARLRRVRESDRENRLSLNHLKVQFAQLETLARIGLLEADDQHAALATPPNDMHTDDMDVSHLLAEDGSVPRPAARRYRLQKFIESREALNDSPERRGAFLLGVLVGQLSHHQQYNRDMNRTLRDQHQAENMTAGKLKRLYRELVDKAGIYASEVDWGGEMLFEETVDELTETLSDAVPDDDWMLSRQDLQFFYALGVGYGTRAEGRATDLIDRAEATAEQSAVEPPAE